MSKLFKGIPEIVVCYDNDEAGQNGAKDFCCSIGYKAKRILWESDKTKGYDLNDLFQECGSKDKFLKEIARYATSAKAEVEPILKPSALMIGSLKARIELDSRGEIVGISSGYSRLDRQFSGISGIWFVGGKPKEGKTTFAGNIAIGTAERGCPTIYMDYENGSLNLMGKISTNVFDLTITELRKKHKEVFNQSKYKAEYARLLKILSNLYIIRPSMRDAGDKYASPQEIATDILEKYILFLRDDSSCTKPILFVIDSLQKLPALNINDKRSSIDGWLRAFECVRDQYNVSFLIISELSRGKYKKPTIEAFKESGDIEYTADVALFLEKQGSVITLNTVANRNGESGDSIIYTADFEHWKLNEMDDYSYQKKIKNDRQ